MFVARLSDFKKHFFDRAAVAKAIDSAERRNLARFGAFVRTKARSLIRTRKRASRPGHPPSSHTGLLRRFIFFAFDPERRSVVVGPALLNMTKSRTTLPALEYGGPTTIERNNTPMQVTIAARPFMRPAMEAEMEKLPAIWRDSIRQ